MFEMNVTYVMLGVSITGLTLLGVLSIFAITLLRPQTDNGAIILQIVSLLTPTLIALIGAFKSIQTAGSVKELKTSVQDNTAHLEKQGVVVAELKEKVADVKVTADTAKALAEK